MRFLSSLGSKLRHTLTRKWLISVAILTFGIAFSFTMMATAPKYTDQSPEEKALPVVTIQAQPGDGVPLVQLFGQVDTPRRAQLSAAVAANVQQLWVSEGQFVSKGDLLLTLDDSEITLTIKRRQADVNDASADLQSLQAQQKADKKVLEYQRELYALSQAKIERLQTLHKDNLISASTLDEARSQSRQQAIQLEQQKNTVASQPYQLASARARLQRAQALLQQAQLDLSRTQVTAPFAGAISELHVSPGDRVNIGNNLVSVFDTSALQVRAAIPSGYLKRVRDAINQGGTITAKAQVDGMDIVLRLNQLTARVAQGRSGIDGLFQIVASTPESAAIPMALGRMLNLEMDMPVEHQVVAVPIDAVYDNKRIYLVEEERLKALNIEVVGETDASDGQRQLLVRAESLLPGSLIVTTQLLQATSGLKVSALDT